jgi:hypothetical protein
MALIEKTRWRAKAVDVGDAEVRLGDGRSGNGLRVIMAYLSHNFIDTGVKTFGQALVAKNDTPIGIEQTDWVIPIVQEPN